MSTNIVAVQIKDLRHTLNLTQKDFARTVGSSLRSVARWEHNQAKVNLAMAKKVETLNDIVRAARKLMDPDEIVEWFNTKNETLGGKKPIELLSTYSGMTKVHRVLSELEWGIIG